MISTALFHSNAASKHKGRATAAEKVHEHVSMMGQLFAIFGISFKLGVDWRFGEVPRGSLLYERPTGTCHWNGNQLA